MMELNNTELIERIIPEEVILTPEVVHELIEKITAYTSPLKATNTKAKTKTKECKKETSIKKRYRIYFKNGSLMIIGEDCNKIIRGVVWVNWTDMKSGPGEHQIEWAKFIHKHTVLAQVRTAYREYATTSLNNNLTVEETQHNLVSYYNENRIPTRA